MNNVEIIKKNKNAVISRNNYNSNIIPKNQTSGIIKGNFFDNFNEKDFISYKINKKYNRKHITKSITTTIKYEYKSSNDSFKNNEKKDNINSLKNDKYSTILRSQSSLLNNRPTDNFYKKNINNEISNYKSKKNKNDKKEKIVLSSSNKGFKNFNLNKVCGSSHPLKEKNKKDNEENKENKKNEYKFIKSYTLKYDYKEENDYSINNNNKRKTPKFLNENNDMDNNKINVNRINNNEVLLLPESQESKIYEKSNKHKSLSCNNLNNNYQIQRKVEEENKIDNNNNGIYDNKKILDKNIHNLKMRAISKKDINPYVKFEENNKTNNNIIIKSNLIYSLNNQKHKSFYSRNNNDIFESSKEILNRRIKNNYKNKKNKKNLLNTYNKYFYNYEDNKLNKLLFKESKISKNNYLKNNNTFISKTINFMKKKYYGNMEKADCIMPANNLRNIIIKNENEFFFKTNYPSKLY